MGWNNLHNNIRLTTIFFIRCIYFLSNHWFYKTQISYHIVNIKISNSINFLKFNFWLSILTLGWLICILYTIKPMVNPYIHVRSSQDLIINIEFPFFIASKTINYFLYLYGIKLNFAFTTFILWWNLCKLLNVIF